MRTSSSAQAVGIRAERAKSGRTLLDGTRLIGAYAERFGFKAVTLLVNDQARTVRSARLLEAVEPRRVFLLADELLRKHSVETAEGVTAIVESRGLYEIPGRFSRGARRCAGSGNVGDVRTAAAGATSAYLPRDARTPGRRNPCAVAWARNSCCRRANAGTVRCFGRIQGQCHRHQPDSEETSSTLI